MFFFFSSRRRHTRYWRDWSSDVCSSDLKVGDKVVVDVDPREHNTTPHRRFHGKIGIIEEVGRRTLKVSVRIGNKKKILQTRFNHIKLLAGTPEMSRAGATTSAEVS